jgi:Flp pilus assembly protein TadG
MRTRELSHRQRAGQHPQRWPFLVRFLRKRLPGYKGPAADEGSVLIETALGFMLMMTMILAIMECCMMAYTYSVLEDGVREGVRYAAVHGIDSTTCSGPSAGCDATAANVISDVTTYVAKYVKNTNGMVVTVTYPDGASTASSRVQVAITMNYSSLFHIAAISPALSVSSQTRIEY